MVERKYKKVKITPETRYYINDLYNGWPWRNFTPEQMFVFMEELTELFEEQFCEFIEKNFNIKDAHLYKNRITFKDHGKFKEVFGEFIGDQYGKLPYREIKRRPVERASL